MGVRTRDPSQMVSFVFHCSIRLAMKQDLWRASTMTPRFIETQRIHQFI